MMITKEKVSEYISFNGDIDGWVRCNADKKGILTEDEWSLIDIVVSEIGLIRKELVAPEFRDEHAQKIHGTFDSTATYDLLVAYENKERTRRER